VVLNIVISISVCLYDGLSAYLNISKATRPIFVRFSVHYM